MEGKGGLREAILTISTELGGERRVEGLLHRLDNVARRERGWLGLEGAMLVVVEEYDASKASSSVLLAAVFERFDTNGNGR